MVRTLLISLCVALGLGACQTVPAQSGFTAEQRAELVSHGFVETDDGWQLSMADRLLFETDSATPRAEMLQTVDRIANGLLRVGISAARVEGHTDSVGADDYNLRLSTARANAIASELVARGFARERVIERGWGETRPVADNGDASGRQLNRRVVIIVSPE